MAQSASPLSHLEPVRFPDWKEALRGSRLPGGRQGVFEREIIAFLHACKQGRAPATIA